MYVHIPYLHAYILLKYAKYNAAFFPHLGCEYACEHLIIARLIRIKRKHTKILKPQACIMRCENAVCSSRTRIS
jgi:hypothetical protein